MATIDLEYGCITRELVNAIQNGAAGDFGRAIADNILERIREEGREIATLRARVKELETRLKEHHDWHLAQGPVPAEFVGLDMSLEYSDSSLCERTVAALMNEHNTRGVKR